MFKRVLIANRGEIAVRLIRACRELGVQSAAVYSDADREALHARLADSAAHIGGSAAAESYLNQPKVLAAASELGCDAVHPGYGFLAENPDFAQAALDAGLGWIGPPPESMRLMGLKIAAREVARQAGAPVVPGFEAAGASDADYAHAVQQIGCPVLVKASAGGGGKGMRLLREPAELPAALAAARREAQAAFGDAAVYLEKYIDSPRHIEIQVLADQHGNCVHLGERECSIQRRHQKLIEESPSTAISPELRGELGSQAVSIARAAGYVGAGTVEFILAPDGSHYFLEVNARLQVEHPVTELVYGLDLAQWQLRIAAGEPLALAQAELVPRGHAIECRICAEDPATGFLPQVGRIELLAEPVGPGIRVDSALYQGMEVGTDYDPLLSKLIVWAPDRAAAIARMLIALREYRILGVTTNLAFLQDVIAHPRFRAGELSTSFIAEHMQQWGWSQPDAAVLGAAALALAGPQRISTGSNGVGELPSVWQALAEWSNT